MRAKELLPLLATLLFCNGAAAGRQLQYTITPLQSDIPTTEGAILQVVDFNNKGEVLLKRFFDGRDRAYLWRRGDLIDLTERIAPAPAQVIPFGMNDRTVVVGNLGIDGFVLFKQRVRLIDVSRGGTLGPTPAVQPVDINNRGQILGKTDFIESPGEETFLLSGKKIAILEPLPGDLATVPTSLNDRGIAVGESAARLGGHAVVWQRGTVMEIAMPIPFFVAIATDINNRNEAVGTVSFEDGQASAFAWNEGSTELLPSPSATLRIGVASSVNDCGDIVGTSLPLPVVPQSGVATLWQERVARDVNELISDADPLKPFVSLIAGVAINDAGQIVAIGIDSRIPQEEFNFIQEGPYLLTPVRVRESGGAVKEAHGHCGR